MFSIEVEGYRAMAGRNCIELEIEEMDKDAALQAVEGMLDEVIDTEDVLDCINNIGGLDVITEYVVENEDPWAILDNMDDQDVIDYALTDITEPRKLTKVLNTIMEEVGIEELESKVLQLKKKVTKEIVAKGKAKKAKK